MLVLALVKEFWAIWIEFTWVWSHSYPVALSVSKPDDFGDYEWFELWASSNYETGVEEDLEGVLNWEEAQAGREGCLE